MPAPVPRRWFLLCALAAAVLALHFALLRLWGPAWFEAGVVAPVAPRALQVRSVEIVPALAPRAPAPDAPEARRAPARPRPAPAAPTAPTAPTGATAEAVQAPQPEVEAARDADPPAPSADPTIEVPVYATRLPPQALWRYRMQRGLVQGEAELAWARPEGAAYELRLEGRVAGVTVLDWVSRGQVDAAGLAPERFVLRQRGRDRQAANFQREAGKISFSGPTHEQPLLPGAQDRLSWLLQLPAIVDAAPERFVEGASVVLFVAGARGDADVWTFAVQGFESLDGRRALKLVREPRRRYDTRVDVWLDPAEQHLPLRVVQTPSGGGAALELQREPAPR
jgi:Protein of unknown function (DUF3108)